jgi:hypothetical protein
MLYIERKPALPLRRSVRSLWYASTSFVEHRRERILPSGCAHIVVSLSQDFLTDCPENRPEQRTAPALMVGQRSVYEIVATADLVDLAGVLFMPGAVPAFVGDRADLISNRNLPPDEIWSGYTDKLRSRMLEGSSPFHQVRRGTAESCGEAGSDAGMGGRRPVRCSLGAPVRPDRYTPHNPFGLGRPGHLRDGTLRGHLVAQNAGRRVEPGRRVEAGAQASGTRPLRAYAPSHFHGRSADGPGTAIASDSLAAFAGLASFVGGFWIKLNQEERLLLRGFPDEYPAYKVRVKALIPYVF